MEGERGSVLLFGTSSFPPPEKVACPNDVRTTREVKEARHPVIYARTLCLSAYLVAGMVLTTEKSGLEANTTVLAFLGSTP